MDPRSTASLERIILKEIGLHERYVAVLKEERIHTAKINPEKISELTSLRELIVGEMKLCHHQRMEITAQFPNSRGQKLTALVERHASPEDQKRLLPLLKKLRAVVERSQKKTYDFGSVARFGLTMVEGLLSIIWSATQHVTKSYSRQGTIKEQTQPAGTRAGSVLKKA